MNKDLDNIKVSNLIEKALEDADISYDIDAAGNIFIDREDDKPLSISITECEG